VPLYQVGLIPDNKLLDLLDMALAADTVNTVKGMRDLLESGVDALSLVAQLASLITNIIVGTFELSRDARKKGFFRRNLRKLHHIFTNSSILHVFEYMILDSSYCNLHNLTFTCKEIRHDTGSAEIHVLPSSQQNPCKRRVQNHQ
jgi:hypothetical protein